MTKIAEIPTNILTGFLGVGKTSTILNLLKQKPESERWAVLVNEFGEVGVDGSLFAGQSGETDGVHIREVPGGCMCCAAGLPMQMALNMLLAKAKPHRLLIEPTGLGHPLEILETLSSEYYRELLDIQRVVTLVDARQLADSRYTDHETFNQQIQIADLIIGNKRDLYTPEDQANLERYAQLKGKPGVDLVFAQHGEIDLSLLTGSNDRSSSEHDHAHSHSHSHSHNHNHSEPAVQVNDQPLPESGYLKAVNQGEGFWSIGWRFSNDWVFDRAKLFSLLSGLEVERLKAVFLTDQGTFGYNLAGNSLTEVELTAMGESRVEVIARDSIDDWEQELLDCGTR